MDPGRRRVLDYFAMWNGGDPAEALRILHPDWVDHAHPEVAGPQAVRDSVRMLRATGLGVRFEISSVLADGDLYAAVGEVVRDPATPATRLVWLIRQRDDLLAEMWTYHTGDPAQL
jgi:hypothetical protein